MILEEKRIEVLILAFLIGIMGIALNNFVGLPETNSTFDINAADRKNIFEFGLFADPIVKGDYPEIMRQMVRKKDANEVKGME